MTRAGYRKKRGNASGICSCSWSNHLASGIDGLPQIWVKDGQRVVARIYGADDAFQAVLANGRSIGVYPTLKSAREAVWRARAA
jgi:hypothetical protein